MGSQSPGAGSGSERAAAVDRRKRDSGHHRVSADAEGSSRNANCGSRRSTMKILALYLAVVAGTLGLAAFAQRTMLAKMCWCWPPIQHKGLHAKPKPESMEYVAYGSYGTEIDWNNPDHIYKLDFNQDQGRRVFYQHCVWCHADSTP